MASFGSTRTRVPMPLHELPVHQGQFNTTAVSPIMANLNQIHMSREMNGMDQNFLRQAQSFQLPSNGTGIVHRARSTVSAYGAAKVQTTLDLKVISTDMTPTSVPEIARSLFPRLSALFARLSQEDAALLQLVECFTFLYRQRRPYEGPLQASASLYYERLKNGKSRMCDQIDEVIGFRCCGCRHTTQSPRDYVVGAAQLVISEAFRPDAIVLSLCQLKDHMRSCRFLRDDLQHLLMGGTVKHGCDGGSLVDYLVAWSEGVSMVAEVKMRPRVMAYQNVGTRSKEEEWTGNLGSFVVGNGDLSAGTGQHMNDSGRSHFQMQQRHSAPSMQSPQISELPVCSEDEIFKTLEGSVFDALVESNFGLLSGKPRTLVAALSELPAPGVIVSPVLEVLLQSLSVTQRQRYPAPLRLGAKRSHQEIQTTFSSVFLECIYCRRPSGSFCFSAGGPQDVANFILLAFSEHLVHDCGGVPTSLKRKVCNIIGRLGRTRDELARAVKECHTYWSLQIPNRLETKRQAVGRGRAAHASSWRPISWRFIEDVGAAAISDRSLALKPGCGMLPCMANKKAVSALKDDDVLFGWDGEHLGNRRFLRLVSDFRLIFFAEGVSDEQQHIIAMTIVRKILQRSGKFYFVGSDHIAPPSVLSFDRASVLTLHTFKRGVVVLLNPPPNPAQMRRSGCVTECEIMPQRTMFGKEVLFNKSLKKLEPDCL